MGREKLEPENGDKEMSKEERNGRVFEEMILLVIMNVGLTTTRE